METKATTSTKIKTSYLDFSDRQNSQFKEIAQKYFIQKKQRKQFNQRKNTVENQVKHFQKLNASLQKSLSQKQHQLRWIKQVRERYLASINNKRNLEEQKKKKLEQLKNYNSHLRKKSVQNIHHALDQLHKKKSKAHDEVQKNLGELRQRYSMKKNALDQANHSMYLSIRRSKAVGQKRVDKFFQQKNTKLARFYKSLTNQYQEAFISGAQQIQQLQMKQSRFKEKITKKQERLQKIISQIDQLKKSSKDIASKILASTKYNQNCTTIRTHSKLNKVSRTQRIEPQEEFDLGFKLMQIGSKQFIDQEEIH